MNRSYFMEGVNEARRLKVKDRTDLTRQQLIDTGISRYMRAGCCVVDAGSGVGVVAEQIADLAEQSEEYPHLILLDSSQERLGVADARLKKYHLKKQFQTCDLENTGLPDKSVDYLFCRFVFEYLENPELVFNEFIRVMKPGGKLVIGDLDNNGITHYHLPDELQRQLNCIATELQSKCHFDFQAGRKLYSYFYESNCEYIDVHFYAHHLFFGEIEENDDFNWTVKFDRLMELQKSGDIQLDFSVSDFSKKFMEFLRSPRRFSYTPLILVEGVVSHE